MQANMQSLQVVLHIGTSAGKLQLQLIFLFRWGPFFNTENVQL